LKWCEFVHTASAKATERVDGTDLRYFALNLIYDITVSCQETRKM